MEEQFKIFRRQIDKDIEKDSMDNPFRNLRAKYGEKKISFYDFLDQMQSYNKVLYQLADYLNDTGLAKIEIFDGNVIFTTRPDNIKIMFNGKERRGIPFEFINWGFYEKPEYDLYNRLLSDGMTILDVGANIGWYSLLWGKKYPHSIIHAFEPVPDVYRYLSANIVLNGLTNVVLHPFGLSYKNEELSFYFHPMITGLASSQNILRYAQVKELKCKVTPLDDLLERLGTHGVDFMKCDVEGAELNVLKGALQTIERDMPMISLELFHEWSCSFDYHPDEPMQILKQMGYRVFLPFNGQLEEVSRYIPHEYDRQNYFFLHREKHGDLISRVGVVHPNL